MTNSLAATKGLFLRIWQPMSGRHTADSAGRSVTLACQVSDGGTQSARCGTLDVPIASSVMVSRSSSGSQCEGGPPERPSTRRSRLLRGAAARIMASRSAGTSLRQWKSPEPKASTWSRGKCWDTTFAYSAPNQVHQTG